MIQPRSLADLSRNPPPEPPCYIKGLIPAGKMILVGGCKGIGKSWVAMEMTRALATGTPLFGSDAFAVANPVRPWLLDRELGWWTASQRWERFDPDKRIENALVHCADLRLDSTAGINEITDSVGACNANVLIIDCINRFIGGNLNDNAWVTECLERINGIIRVVPDLSIVMIHHFRKPSKDSDPLDIYNFQGAGTFVNFTDSQVACFRPGVNTELRDTDGPYWQMKVRCLTRHSAAPGGDLLLEIKPSTVLPVKMAQTTVRRRGL